MMSLTRSASSMTGWKSLPGFGEDCAARAGSSSPAEGAEGRASLAGAACAPAPSSPSEEKADAPEAPAGSAAPPKIEQDSSAAMKKLVARYQDQVPGYAALADRFGLKVKVAAGAGEDA